MTYRHGRTFLLLALSGAVLGSAALTALAVAPQGKKKAAAKTAKTAKPAAAKPAAGGGAAAPAPAGGAATPAQLALGKKVFDAQGCAVCHSVGGKGGSAGPDLTSVGANPTHTAAWISAHILNPKTHTPSSTMPAYAGKIKAPELTALSLFLAAQGAKSGAGGGPATGGAVKVGPQDKTLLAKIEKFGGAVRQIAQTDERLEVDYHMQGGTVTDAALIPLAGLKGVLELNLAKTQITDAGLAHLKGLTSLTTLHLEGTKVSDAGLVHLKGLKNLEYLNLYGTNVTDAGLDQLTGLKNLKHLYVWQSKVTKAGADKLKTALPQVDVVMGWDAEVKK